MHVGKKSQKREKSVMSVSLYGNVVFVVIELVMAIATGSQAVLLDAVYDGVEFFMLLPSVFLIPLLYRPSNEQHPFGYMQLETLFVVVKGITMAAVTFGLIFNNIHLMLHGGHIVSFHTIAGFEMFACILSVIVTIYLRIKNKNLHSPLITMELQGWQIDSVISLGMAFAFLLPLMIPFAWFDRVTPYLDQIITILLNPRSHADSTRGRNNRRHQKDRRTNHRYLRPQKSILRYCKNRKKTLDQRLHHIRQRYRIAVKIQTPAR